MAEQNDPSVRLAAYKRVIDDDIVQYAKHVLANTRAQYGAFATLEVEAFLDMLSRGGKRIRGTLVMVGYEMCGGTDRAMIVHAARAIEMMHAYALIVDDIQDRAILRRGKPATYRYFAEYHKTHRLKGDADHAGIALALNAAMAGAHAAEIILANLPAEPQLRLNVLSIMNRTMMITYHGQMTDIMNSLVDKVDPRDIDRVLEWKTALYSFINPIHVGMVLAGGGCEHTDGITPFALHLGRAFQITDDILGIFGDEQEVGKSPLDDVREGKATLLSTYALAHAAPDDAAFLRQQLGNTNLTQKAFERCKQIIKQSGALRDAQDKAGQEIAASLTALDTHAHMWPNADIVFLRSLAARIQNRTA
jgi:geranylgeranyl diphosphate synthase type I